MKLAKLIIILFIVIAAIITFYYFSKKPIQNENKRYLTARQTTIVQRVTISGILRPARQSIIVAPYNGYIKKLYVKLGQNVKAGKPIVSIVEDLQSQEQVYPIRAPFNGTIVAMPKSEGEFVKQDDINDFIVRIDDLSKYYVDSQVAEVDIPKIKVGQQVSLKVIPITTKIYHGIVRSVSLAPHSVERWFNRESPVYYVKIEILNKDAQLLSGMSVMADVIITPARNILLLPHEFVARENSERYVILKDGEKLKVLIGNQSAAGIEILSGLKSGDIVQQISYFGK